MLRPLFASIPFSAGNLQGTILYQGNVMCPKWGFAKSGEGQLDVDMHVLRGWWIMLTSSSGILWHIPMLDMSMRDFSLAREASWK